MTVKKTPIERQPIPIDPIDPAVENVLGKPQTSFYTRLERMKRMTPAQRRKVERDQKRNKETYDLPAWLSQAVEMIAAAYQVPKSNVAAHLLAYGVNGFLEKKVIFDDEALILSRSPRYLYLLTSPNTIDLDKLETLLKGHKWKE